MTIDDLFRESKALSKNIQDVTNFRREYMYGMISFDSPTIDIFKKHYDYLKANSTITNLNIKYHYKPEYLSYDTYQTTKLYEMLMYINNCHCIEEFTMLKVYIPDYDAVFNVLKDYLTTEEKIIQLQEFTLG